jgi:thiamine-monophosphate kinase
MREFDLIARLKPLLPANDSVVAGAGDDCAVLDLGDPLHHALFKTDAVVEGIHFTRDTDPEQVGHKAIARCLSDIAAMGGEATAAVVTLGLPDGRDVEWSEALYRGLCRTAARFHVAVVGGETTTVPERSLVSVSMIGRVVRGMARMRSMARVGDAVLVSGELGGSIAGHHLTFEPRMSEGRWLAGQTSVHALMDLSDGLAGDLRQVLTASGDLGAIISGGSLPISRAARLRAREGDLARPALVAALTDGEDFELLFTVERGAVVGLMDGWRTHFPNTRITCIGKITAGPEILLHDSTGMRPMPRGGYEHFHGNPA